MKIFFEFFSAIWELIKLPFVLIAISFSRMYSLGWRKISMLGVAAFVLTAAALTTFFKVTSNPSFCGSCHIMRPYIEAWENSSHSDVDCMTCHAHEGLTGYFETKFTAVSMLTNYATGLYRRSKPWAEIDDANCLQGGCHETRLMEGEIGFSNGIIFDHNPHLTDSRRGRKLRCTSCHSQIVQGEHISVTTSTCYLCHFKNVNQQGRRELSECLKCHIPPAGELAAEKNIYDHQNVVSQKISCQSCHQKMWQGRGEVRRERCGNCHSSIAHIDRINDLEFIHEWHIEKRKVDCQQCHDAIEHGNPDLHRMSEQNCNDCHESQHSSVSFVYAGTGSKLLEHPMPDTMKNSGVICLSCHSEDPENPSYSSSDGKTCTPCHAESYRRLATDWKKGYTNKIGKLERELKNSGFHARLEDARHDLALLKHGGAWHNPKFADSVLSRVSEVLAATGARRKIPGHLSEQSKSCLTCHNSIDDIPVKLDLSAFNHSAHLSDRKIACIKCHQDVSPNENRHGKLIRRDSSCDECHHNEENFVDNTCSPCHMASRMLYFGKLPGKPDEPSPMAETDMNCIDCHQSPDFSRPKDAFCLDCHEQETIDDLEYMRGEFVIDLQNTRSKVGDDINVVRYDRGRAVHHPNLAKKILKQ